MVTISVVMFNVLVNFWINRDECFAKYSLFPHYLFPVLTKKSTVHMASERNFFINLKRSHLYRIVINISFSFTLIARANS